MADEPEASSGGDRPVEPPIIDLEAEEVDKAEEKAPENPAAEAPDDSRTRARPKKSISPAAVSAGVAIIAGASILAALGFIDFRNSARDESLNPRLEALEAASEQIQVRMGELTAAINELRQQSAQPRVAQSDNQVALEQQLQTLESRIGTLNRAIEDIGISLKTIESRQSAQQGEVKSAAGLIGELQSRLNTERQQVPADKVAANELASALVRLKAAAEEGRPFGGELQRLSAIMPEEEGLKDLEEVSASGAARRSELSDRFRSIVEELKAPVAAQAEAPEPAGVWDTFKAKAASLISVRKLEDAKWLDAAESATERLNEGDLRGAVQILGSVEGKPPPLLEAWLGDAAARLKVDKAIGELSASVLKQLGSGS